MDFEVSDKFEVLVSIRFELFYAMQALFEKNSRIHYEWVEKTKANLPDKFFINAKILGNSSLIWGLLADTLKDITGDISFNKICQHIKKMDAKHLQKEIIIGSIHNANITKKLIANQLSLQEAITRIPKVKQEWLGFIGLYPFQAESPIATVLQLLLDNPDKFKATVAECLILFWENSFQQTWEQIKPLLCRSANEKTRLLHSCSFEEFAKQTLLRIEVDESKKVIRAARGGYELAAANIRKGFLIPSAFNDKRFWTSYEFNDGDDVYFPYFDPSISIEAQTTSTIDLRIAEIDPFLMCKALGDSTRYAIISLLGKKKQSSADIAKELNLSKPTISHHVHVLRDAGIIKESQTTQQAGAVLLSPNRAVIESLSQSLCKNLLDIM